MKVKGDVKAITVTQAALAKAMGVTRARINQMIKEDIVIRNDNDQGGGIFLYDSVKNYFSGQKNVKKDNDDAKEEVNYMEEKAKHEAASRKLAELKLAKAEGRALDARVVEMVLIEDFSVIRTQMLGLPAKVIPRLEHKSCAEMDDILTKEIEEALVGLSEISPASFMQEEIDDEDDT